MLFKLYWIWQKKIFSSSETATFYQAILSITFFKCCHLKLKRFGWENWRCSLSWFSSFFYIQFKWFYYFLQALSVFSAALQSGQLAPLMQQFNLSQPAIDAAAKGGEDFFEDLFTNQC